MPESVPPAPVPALSGNDLLSLAHRDPEAASAKLRLLAPEAQAQACCELRAEVRSEFLMLLDHPEHVVPLLPAAELCLTIRSSGMSEAAWLLELGTTEQLRACFDLDCWSGYELDLKRVTEWVDALIEAGRENLTRAIREVDLELWVLVLLSMADVVVVGKEDEPPDGWFTIDGMVYFGPREEADFVRVREIASVSFESAQGHYWRLVYGMQFESPAECEEYALRWRQARLSDLGFPDLEQAMQVYRPLQTKEAEVWETTSSGGAVVPTVRVPRRLRSTLLGEALAGLSEDRAIDKLGYILAVANSIAVADRLLLSDTETIPKALDKAVRGIERGLRELAGARQQPMHDVLDTTLPLDLFRIGATLDRALRER